MKKVVIKSLCLLLMLFSCSSLTFARVMQKSEVSSEGNESTSVYAIIDSYFEIKVPKSLTINKATKSTDYTITVKGDISGNKRISVIPDETFLFSQVNKDDVLATVEQEKQLFSGKELIASSEHESYAYGTVSAPNLTGGHWTGELTFTVSSQNVAKQTIGNYDCQVINDKAFLTKYNGSDENVVVPATLTDENGKSYQVVFSDSVFKNNRNLKTVSFEKGVYADDGIKNSFSGCSNLTSADLSNLNLDLCRHIDFLFDGCKLLETIDFGNNTLPNLLSASYAFSNCSKITNLDISAWNMSELESDEGMFQYCTSVTELKLPDIVNRIDNFMFNHLSKWNVREIVLPKGIEYIGDTHIFFDCGTGNSVQTGFYAFVQQEDSNVYKVDHGKLYSADMKRLIAVPKVDTNNVWTYYLPDTVETFNGLAFNTNYQMCTLVLSNSFEIKPLKDSVGNYGSNIHVGIYGSCSIDKYSVKASNTKYKEINGCIYSKDGTELLAVPYRLFVTHNNHFTDNTTLTIPEGTTSIGFDAFYLDCLKNHNACAKNKKLSLPSTLLSITDDQIEAINLLISKYAWTVEIADGNTAFELVNNQLVRKQ